MTNKEKAIAALRDAKTIDQWNEIRDKNKAFLTMAELNEIDQSRLIVEVLGQDKISQHQH